VLVERIELGDRKKACVREHRVERRTRVPLAEDESIALGPRGIRGIHAQNAPVQDRQQVDYRKARADVRALPGAEHLTDAHASAAAERFDLWLSHSCIAPTGIVQSRAPMFSSTCCGRLAPTIATSMRRSSTHRIAACAGVLPHASAVAARRFVVER